MAEKPPSPRDQRVERRAAKLRRAHPQLAGEEYAGRLHRLATLQVLFGDASRALRAAGGPTLANLALAEHVRRLEAVLDEREEALGLTAVAAPAPVPAPDPVRAMMMHAMRARAQRPRLPQAQPFEPSAATDTPDPPPSEPTPTPQPAEQVRVMHTVGGSAVITSRRAATPT